MHSPGAFPLAAGNSIASIYLQLSCAKAISLAAEAFRSDVEEVTGRQPTILRGDAPPEQEHVLLVGEYGNAPLLDSLARENRLPRFEELEGAWEQFLIVVVENPWPGVTSALVIVGSDRRGAVYGLYELSRRIGVSPWNWWAGVPVKHQSNLFLSPGTYFSKEPSVKYRGMFINDEIFGLAPWAKNTFEPEQELLGPRLYAKICELLLRLKANLLVPAMKKGCGPFNGIPENRQVAHEHGIVVGSAHSEPLAMSTFDWKQERDGPWDYLSNGPRMLEFLEQRVAEGKECERVYSVGLRGVDDHSMAGGLKPLEQVRVLREVLGKQRDILQRQLETPPEQIPQALWLYKEILENYDLGLEPPDDVTLIWPDDNYGYIRRLPGEQDARRSGGHGLYYHLSYLGRPFDYLWLSGVHPALMHNELTKAWKFGARKIWLFNIGDIKPLEFELSLAMDLAWDINAIPIEEVSADYTERYFAESLGAELAPEMTAIRTECSRLASLRKPEHMGWQRIEQGRLPVEAEISWIENQEAETLLRQWTELMQRSTAIWQKLPDEPSRDAYLHLLHYRVAGSALMARKWLMNSRYVWHQRQGRASAWESYEEAWNAFAEIWEITDAYMEADGGKWRKWHGMFAFDTYGEPRYRQPDEEKRWIRPDPFVPLETPPQLPDTAEMGVWCQNQDERLGVGSGRPELPCLSPHDPTAFLEIYRKGTRSLDWRISCSDDWLEVGPCEGSCGPDQRITVRLLPEKLPAAEGQELFTGRLNVLSGTQSIEVMVPVARPNTVPDKDVGLPCETRGQLVLAATDFSATRNVPGYTWQSIPGPGASGQVVRIADPTSPALEGEWRVKENNPFLEYQFRTVNRGWFEVAVGVVPTFPATQERGSLYAVTVNDGPELLIDTATRHREEAWMRGVEYNIVRHTTRHFIDRAGHQTLRIYLIDTTLCFQDLHIIASRPETPWTAP